MILSVRSLRQEVLAAYEAAKVADKAWQAELDARGIDRHTARARGAVDPDLRTLYENKIAADQKLRELTETMSLFQRSTTGNRIAACAFTREGETMTYCAHCAASLTDTDYSVGFCTQCHWPIEATRKDDDDEHEHQSIRATEANHL